VITVVCPHLVAVDAAWDDGPDAGRWIADRLGPFGPSVGHAVPLGYPAYAVVPIPADENAEGDRGPLSVIEALLDVLGPFTGDQPVRSGIVGGLGAGGTTPPPTREPRPAWGFPSAGPRATHDQLRM
jgi:hypothetical protein